MTPPSARASTARWCTSPCARSSTRAAGAPRRPRRAATSAAAAPSRGAERAPASARAGSSRSPIWTGGGIVFGPHPRHYTFKVNRKERRAALRSALSAHADRGTIAILDPSPFDTPSTKQASELVTEWAGGGSVLVVLSEDQADVALSFRNLRRVSVLPSSNCGVADLVGAASLLISEDALDELTKRAKGEKVTAADEEGTE